jgi:hypothetical protein
MHASLISGALPDLELILQEFSYIASSTAWTGLSLIGIGRNAKFSRAIEFLRWEAGQWRRLMRCGLGSKYQNL